LNPFDNCLYICDFGNNCIRKITLEGDVSTFAQIPSPKRLVMNFKKQCFFISSENHVIYKITPEGTRSVFVGKENKAGNVDGIGSNALFNSPTGLAIDQKSGNLFVSDYLNCTIRKVTPHGEVSTLAGSKEGFKDGNGKSAEFMRLYNMFYDPSSESLLVCDGDKLRRVLMNGDVTTLCEIYLVCAVVVTDNQTIFVSARYQLYRVTCSESQYTAVPLVGKPEPKESVDGRAEECSFKALLFGLAVHEASHSCFVTDYHGHTIRKITFKD